MCTRPVQSSWAFEGKISSSQSRTTAPHTCGVGFVVGGWGKRKGGFNIALSCVVYIPPFSPAHTRHKPTHTHHAPPPAPWAAQDADGHTSLHNIDTHHNTFRTYIYEYICYTSRTPTSPIGRS